MTAGRKVTKSGKPDPDRGEPGADTEARRKRIENDPALSPVGPIGGAALGETASEERRRD